MKFGLINRSGDPLLTPNLFARIASALEHQTTVHYEAVWQSNGAAVTVYPTLEAVPDDGETCPLVVFDDPDVEGDLGYHSILETSGRPFGRVFWHPVKMSGGSLTADALSLSSVISHEALEMLGDPYVNWWCDMPDGGQESLELADRTQGDSYMIGDVAVSNFLGPRSFGTGPGPYDYLGLTKAPFEIRPGGYAIRRSASNGKISYVWGAEVPSWKRKLVSGYGRRSRIARVKDLSALP